MLTAGAFFDALGTRMPFLTPVVGARLPETPMPVVDEAAPIPLRTVDPFILSVCMIV